MSSPDWRVAPPDFSPTLLDWACTSGSLTQRLVATGLPFAVVVTQQGTAYPTADEADYLTLPLRQPVLVREVLLTLADQPVVFARSLTAGPAPHWAAVLGRGRRSLGLTLFTDAAITRRPLQWATLSTSPLAQAARLHFASAAPCLLGRRAGFVLHGETLLVHEVFHPDLALLSPPPCLPT